jgi:deferrochelatase/peroxidase EfeB
VTVAPSEPTGASEPSATSAEDVAPARPTADARAGLSRRALLGAAAAGTAGLVVGGLAGPLLGARPAGSEGSGAVGASNAIYPFFGTHQSGIVTPVQDHLHFAAFDFLEAATRDDVVGVLRDWSYAASRMTQGLDVTATGALGGDPETPPDDTGEALGLPASGLTVTFGLGPTLFERDGVDRFGLAAQRPPELERLPPFLGDALKTGWSHGDLCVQVCADDPQVAVHAVRNHSRMSFGRAAIRC